MAIIYFIYDLILCFAFLIYLPVIFYKMIFKGKYREGFKERFGFIPFQFVNRLRGEKVIWIHAVSVGETVAASSLVKEIKVKNPELKILFSTVTDTGQSMARKIVQEADEIIYFPLDFSWVVRRVLNKIDPEAVVIMETELWPNFVKEAKKRGTKIMLANGRISDSSATKYKYLGPLLDDMLRNIDLLSMQSRQDVDYILNLGADKERVYNSGNTKFDQVYSKVDSRLKEEIYRKFKLDRKDRILVVGSTHPNEEEQLIYLYKRLKEEFEDLVMILAPRHIIRTNQIEEIYENAGIATICRTEIEKRDPMKESVILLNTIGELGQVYSIADLVFVGGSLIEKGGHNILEPAVHGKLVFFGPHMFNFKDNTRLLLEHGVGIQVSDVKDLTKSMIYYLRNKEELAKKAEDALDMIESKQGASVRNTELLFELMGAKEDEGF